MTTCLLGWLFVFVTISVTTVAVAPAHASVRTSNASRQAIIDSYNAEFSRIEPDSAWNGEHGSCNAGTTSGDYQMSVLSRVNWYRRTVGLSNVAYDSAAQTKVQAAALYQSVAGRLSHSIEEGTTCYSGAASDGSMTSNLALGANGTRAIDMYIIDPGANNAAVGHRRWIMSPTLKAVASGDVEAVGQSNAANALSVVGDTVTSVVATGTPLAWPSSGYFPDALVPERWSFTTAEEYGNYTNASVTVTGPNGPIPANIEYTAGGIVVFQPGISARVNSDTTYRVDISGVTGTIRSNHSYDVTLVDVNEAPRFSGTYSYQAPSCAIVGTAVSGFIIADDGTTTISLVAGVGDTDNSYFRIDNSRVTVARDLPQDRTNYRVRLRVTDDRGAASERLLNVTLVDANSDAVACPVRNLTAKDDNGKVVVSWDSPQGQSGNLFFVYSEPSGGWCQTSGRSCTVTGLTKGKSYTLSVYHVRGTMWSTPATVTHSVGDPKPGTTTAPSTATNKTPAPPTIKRGGTYRLSKLMSIPAGSKRYSVTGPCKLNRSRSKLTAMKRVGRCTVKITATTTRNGVKKTTVRKKGFTVR